MNTAKNLSVPDKHQLRICKDNIKNPLKASILGGPSFEEAKTLLREKFGFSEKQIQKLEQ